MYKGCKHVQKCKTFSSSVAYDGKCQVMPKCPIYC